MIHPSCAERGTHNWDDWYFKICRADGGEITVWPDGSWQVPPGDWDKVYRYQRECQNMGCDAMQFAKALAPVGDSEIVDLKLVEKELARRSES